MYTDFSETTESYFDADICIIGAGAAGFACAVSLLDSGLKILVLEGGLKKFDKAADDLHKAKILNHPHKGIHEARERIVGGTTTKWGGQALPFMQEDFEVRDHIPLSGWPISLAELDPYYKKAEIILGTDPKVSFEYSPWKDWKIEKPNFGRRTISLFVTKWCKIPNFAILHGQKIEASENVTLLANANVVEILPGNSRDEVHSLRILSLNKKKGLVKARYFVAAGGAIETVRLFLVSKKFGENGLGNDRGHVGKYFQDHVAAIVGQIIPKSRKELKELFDPFYKNGFKYFPRIRLDPAFARDKKILHASGQIVFVETDGGVIKYAKEILTDIKQKKLPAIDKIKKLLNPVGIFEVVKAGLRWKIGNRGSSPKFGPVWLEVHSEQDPSGSSYITLGENVDSLGMPRICLHWTISDLTVETIRKTALLIKDELNSSGIGNVMLEPWVESTSNAPFPFLSDVFHQAGGLRMAVDQKTGVVDPSCKVFGINNLFVASSGVFPTSSFSNPTMTTIALAIRVCDNIKKKFSRAV